MRKPTHTCPYCSSPPWRSRYMFWKHLDRCVKKPQSDAAYHVTQHGKSREHKD